MWQWVFHIYCEDFQIFVNHRQVLWSTVEFHANKWITFRKSGSFK